MTDDLSPGSHALAEILSTMPDSSVEDGHEYVFVYKKRGHDRLQLLESGESGAQAVWARKGRKGQGLILRRRKTIATVYGEWETAPLNDLGEIADDEAADRVELFLQRRAEMSESGALDKNLIHSLDGKPGDDTIYELTMEDLWTLVNRSRGNWEVSE
ncbi:hypothetical protein FDA94_28820 [Herbidospora galbida]|uniref:Uncharacterized protein n=1 Tax=Herbidospora galbida TaxID=2575442 RepID=A0A4U3M6S7_9ACTN|nr:hypothetical protein [Herbidospora galbida]TKK84635.1 hypothetical protein FDA94_28820 [Herbidospora galbida]